MNHCKTLIDKHKFDVHIPDNDGWTALHFSARNGSYDLVSYFADRGTNIHLKNKLGWNFLHFAALYGHLNLCKTLTHKYKFDPHMSDNSGWTALHYSARNGSYEILKCFADAGTDIFLQTNDGSNCLHIATLYEHFNVCKKLIDEHHFDVHMTDKDGWAALHYSARNGSYKLLKYLAKSGMPFELKNNFGWNCLHIAALYEHLNLCNTLINKHNFYVHMVDNDGWTALHYSARNGSYALVTYFAAMGKNVYHKTNVGSNCLHIAVLYEHLNLCKKLIDKQKFDIHMADNEGCTTLHYFARNGSYELLTYLADKKTDIDIKSNSGWNCLHLAALCGYFHLCKKPYI